MSASISSNTSVVLEKERGTKLNVGKPVLKIESMKSVKGKVGYTDDLEMADQQYASLLFSPYAHAKIISIDVSKAMALPGVSLVITGKEIKELTHPMSSRAANKSPNSHYILAVDKVRYMGEPVAAVVAKSKYIAQDAVDLIEVDYDPLPVVGSIEDAIKPDAPLIYPEVGSNEIVTDDFTFGDVEGAFKKADTVVKERLRIHRYASTPLETYVINAFYDDRRDELLVYAPDQQPGRTIQSISRTIGIPDSHVHMITPPAGGAFGYKLAMWKYVSLVSLLAKLAGKPVKWVQSRTESLYEFHRPRGYMDAEFALRKDGKVLAMKLEDWQADSNWPSVAALYSLIKFANMSGVYEIPAYSFKYHCIATNDPPIVQDRGVGKPFMAFTMERMMDISASKLGIDKVKIREINNVPPEKMPYTTAAGEYYESGRYTEALHKALEISGYKKLLEEQEKMRKEGRYVGIGISTAVEPGTSNLGYYFLSKKTAPDYNGAGALATVELAPDGVVKADMNAPEIGTGHVTSIAQVVGDVFGIPAEEVNVDSSFDSRTGYLTYAGTYSNLFNDVCLGATNTAATRLRDKIIDIAAQITNEIKEDLYLADGYVCKLDGDEEKRIISLKEVAKISYGRLLSFPKGEEPGLKVTAGYVNKYAKPFLRDDFSVQITHGNGAHIALVEVSPENWNVKILDYTVLHDVGNVINPGIVKGLAIGSTVSGIGGALYEEFVFDEQETNLSLTFGDYLKPTTTEAPEIRLGEQETPCPTTVFGTKAVGEGGAITSLAAVAGAVEDALKPFGVTVTALPLTPEKIWRMVKDTDEYKRISGGLS